MPKKPKKITFSKKQLEQLEEARETMRLGQSFNSIVPVGFRKAFRAQIKDPKLKAIADSEPLTDFLAGTLIKMLLIKPKKK